MRKKPGAGTRQPATNKHLFRPTGALAGHRSTIGGEIHCVGLDIPNNFVAGYGLDYAELYRNLRGVCVLEDA